VTLGGDRGLPRPLKREIIDKDQQILKLYRGETLIFCILLNIPNKTSIIIMTTLISLTTANENWSKVTWDE